VAARRPVSRIGEDRFALRLDEHERRILGSLVDELRQALRDRAEAGPDAATSGWQGPMGDPGDPVSRLYPPAFPDDPEAEAAWSDLVRPSLDDARTRRLERMETTLMAEELDETAAAAWLGALNDMRLVLGSQLGITEDEPPTVQAGDADATRRVIFDYLGFLVATFVDALAEGLPETGRDTRWESG
jgi:uncharacterized protein DUF2017